MASGKIHSVNTAFSRSFDTFHPGHRHIVGDTTLILEFPISVARPIAAGMLCASEPPSVGRDGAFGPRVPGEVPDSLERHPGRCG